MTDILHLWVPPHERPVDRRRCLLIGEIAQAHDGSLGMAHAYIDAIADAGADAVKFQTHIAAEESTAREPWRTKFSAQDATRMEYWKRMEFTEEQWQGLKRHADERGLLFLSSPFSVAAVELLQRVGVNTWKVASGEIANTILLGRMLASGLPMLVSTGMSAQEEIDKLVERLRAAQARFALMQCTTAYPCPPERIGLNVMHGFRERYGCPVGLSDHSGTIFAGLAAAAQGADLVEVHVTFHRKMFGPDVPASVTTEELKQLAEGIAFIGRMAEHPVDKGQLAEDAAALRSIFTQSIVARTALPAGTVLQEAHLTVKKPGTGLPPERMPSLLGRRLKHAVPADGIILENDCE